MDKNSALADAQRTLDAQTELAVRQIAESPALRSFFRRVLREAGVLPQQSVFTPDLAQNAFDQGRQAMGVQVVAMLCSSDPMLWPALQVEEMQEVRKLKELTDEPTP